MEVAVLLLLASIIGSSLQAEWTYNDETHWPGVCTTGLLQSPINIMTRDAVLDIHGAHIRGPLTMQGYEDVTVTATNNGHALKWSREPGTAAPTVSGGPLRGSYTFLQFHLHWLSEHAIDGMKYPLEIHMVHIKTGLSLEEAVLRPDGIAVIGVFGQIYSGDGSSRTLEQIMPQVPYITNSSLGPTKPFNIDITYLISPEPQSYYTYHGSLTTPQCQEVVTWIVMDKPVFVSDYQYKQFNLVDVGGSYNFRSLHPVNRMVYRSVASCSAIIAPSVVGTLASLLSCLSSSVAVGVNKSLCALGNVKRRMFGHTLKHCID